jgi:hypothetical protein
VLWKEWDQGLGGETPAKAYTPAERGANKFTFSHRKVIWDTVEGMIRRGQMADVAINKVYRAYGWNQCFFKATSLFSIMRFAGIRGGDITMGGGYYYAGCRHNN